MRVHAPAKINLCLYLGPRRADGLHELCSLFEPLALADLIDVDPSDADAVLCEALGGGANLAELALAGLRGSGWGHPPLRIEIEKRIPIAAGLGGGSADAAAVLRLAAGEVAELPELAAALGADVPSQLVPALSLVQGAGELVERLPEPEPHAVVLLPGGGGLSTAEVFGEADRLGLGRGAGELARIAARLRAAAGAGGSPLSYPDLLVNDLEPAARTLRPEIGDALEALRSAGAGHAILTGTGPTAVGICESLSAAERVAERLGRDDAILCEAGAAP